ncbi:putative immune-type receptor 12a precursor, partial [Clarias magur]
LLSEILCSLTLLAKVGDKVTIWCQHELTVTGSIFWFKHKCDSAPLLLGYEWFFKSASPEKCHFFTVSERIMMSVHDKNTSLTITAVNVSDTGLYYCAFNHKININNSTNLEVKGIFTSTVFFMLIVGFGAVIVILLSVLITMILKYRKTHKGAEAEDKVVPESDSVNYAALQFHENKSKRNRRHDEMVDLHVIYSSV